MARSNLVNKIGFCKKSVTSYSNALRACAVLPDTTITWVYILGSPIIQIQKLKAFQYLKIPGQQTYY
jgi:hypothetical protein